MLDAMLLMALAQEVAPAVQAQGPVTRPGWLQKPTADDIARAYPRDAASRALAGLVTIECTITDEGRLKACVPTVRQGDAPEFGPAGVKLGALFRMGLTDAGGVSAVGRVVHIPIRFVTPFATLKDIVLTDPSFPEGSAQVNCRVTSSSEIDNCLLTREEPRGAGLGDLALKAAPKIKLKSTIDQRFQVTMVFRSASPEPPPATPDQTAARPSVVTTPDWRRKATGEDVAQVYPRDAARRHINGAAIVQCGVLASGDLSDCVVLQETPEGMGFGAAALKLAAYFKMRPLTRDGAPVAGGTVRIPLRFTLPN